MLPCPTLPIIPEAWEECIKMVVSVHNPGNPVHKPFVSDSRKRSTVEVMLRFEG